MVKLATFFLPWLTNIWTLRHTFLTLLRWITI